MITVDEAQARLLALTSPLRAQTVPIEAAIGRFLAEDIIARRSQPAAHLSAMDGYAIRFADLSGPFEWVGESAAGKPFAGDVGPGEAVRIFTGAHVPAGANSVLIQEDARIEGTRIELSGDGPAAVGQHIRRRGADFMAGDVLVATGAFLGAGPISAAAMGGYGEIAVGRMPRIKIVATGNELVPPGQFCDDAHLPSSNNIMLCAMLAPLPCSVVDAGIVPDELALTTDTFADAGDYDIIVTSGGASVGDHDFVQAALKAAGAEIDFWRVAMRPGKPLMAGRIGTTIVLGLPGNPSSAFVTAFLFLLPLVRKLAGSGSPLPVAQHARVTTELRGGDNRAEYMRASVADGSVTPFARQDSGMIVPLVEANGLIVRPAECPATRAGEMVAYIAL